MDRVSLDLGNGRAGLHGLNISDPEGFAKEYLIKLDEVTLTLDLDSVLSDPVIVKEILVQRPSVIYEIAGDSSNLDSVLKNIKSYTGGSEKTDESSSSGQKMIIEDIFVKDGQVSMSHSLLKG